MVLPLTGTVAVENGLDTFTWTGAPLTPLNCVVGASIVVNGLGYFVKELTDTSHGVFTRVYAEATNASHPAEIEQLSPDQVATATLNKRAAEVFAQISVIEANGRGFLVRFSANTTDAAPGPGYMAIDHASIASATLGYFDNLDGDGAAADVEIDTWDDSSSITKGFLSLRSLSDPSARHLFKVSGTIVDGGGYRKVSWAYVGGSGSFVADEELMAFFSPKGDRGDGFITDADTADPSGLAVYESETAGYLVFVTDLSTLYSSAYIGRSGVVRLIAGPDWELAALYTGVQGAKGDQGDKGWSPRMVMVSNGARRVWQLSGYVGGEGAAPTANVGDYLKGDGSFTAIIEDAADVRGPGGTGTVGEIVAGEGIAVNITDPTAPIVSADVTEDSLLTFFSVTNMEAVERTTGGSILAGPDGNGIFDGFGTLTNVNVAGATNLDSSVVGKLKPTPSTVTPASAGPFSTPTDFTTFTMGDRSWKLNNSQVCTKLGFMARAGTQTVTMMILKRNSPGNYDVVVSESHTYTIGADGWTDKSLSVPYSVPASGDYYVAVKTTTMASLVWSGTRLYYTGTATGAGVTFTEDSGNRIGTRATQISGSNNVIVSSVAMTLATPPTWAMLFAFAKLETAVLNTDFIMSVSRNGAAYGALTLIEKYARPDGSKLYASGRADISGITSGTSCKWRWTTANNKAPELLAVGLLLGN
ncbi:hypothetical protein PSC71_08435 [Devosia sp. J2-20]|uniref:hypothetical protein n=1 Tax=Devosia sp. J2-20 TaxID=3026161 RepID=UPI00249C1776|nr:hypothetical protein [Devosia sp. J2-20]WDR00761.1 hypothetical protein PSC71_08435 [Devosia sp. J2-20]